ncbi:MAG TPA: type II CAAX endopeptidase family protein [Polyangiaceae bacterium]|nr:type II CAAX endopeptidase family protein [Polyangiaceae bacterium]
MLDHRSRDAGDMAKGAPQTFLFFAAALGITWLLQLPAVLAKEGVIAGPVERFMLPAALGGFGPLVAAILAARLEAGGAGVRALFARLRRGPVGAIWYVVALGIFAAIYLAGTAVYRILGGADAGRWLYPPENAQHIAAMIVVPFAEEPGWRGFALPRLQARHGALKASLLLGVVWALWHTMMFILQGATSLVFLVSMANIIAGSVIFSWIYNRTRESLAIALLAHVGVHWNNPYHALPEELTPFVVYTVAIALAACAMVIGDRKVWQAGRAR